MIQRLKGIIFNNWTLKAASLCAAVVLWFTIYMIEDPTASKRLSDVPVKLINTDMVTSNNQVYEVLDGTDVVRSIILESTRSTIDDLESDDIHVEADFAKMKLDGTIELQIYSDRHNDSLEFKPSSTELKVLVENRISKYLSMEVELVGEPTDGYIIGSSKLEQNRIHISGGERAVRSVDKAVARVDIDGTSSDVFSYADIMLLDSEGNEVSEEKLELSMGSVSATVEILATKTVPVVYEVSGQPAEGFVLTGEESSTLTEIMIAGKESALAHVSRIVVDGEELSVEGAEADVIAKVDVDEYLPSGVRRADLQGNGQVEVTIHTSPIIEREYTITMGRSQIINVPEGFTAEHIMRSSEVLLVLRGPEYILNDFSIGNVYGTIDISAWMTETGKRRLRDNETLLIEAVYEVGEDIEVVSSTPVEIITKILEE